MWCEHCQCETNVADAACTCGCHEALGYCEFEYPATNEYDEPPTCGGRMEYLIEGEDEFGKVSLVSCRQHVDAMSRGCWTPHRVLATWSSQGWC